MVLMDVDLCTNSLMKEGEEFFRYNKPILSYLNYIKIYYFQMINGLKWIPSSVNKPKIGMVFLDGTDINNWEMGWC